MDTRERYMVDVVNLPRLPLPELMKQLDDLGKLISNGWELKIFDDVPKLSFVFVAYTLTGLATRVIVPYAYMEDLGDKEHKEKLQQLWEKHVETDKILFGYVAELLADKARQVKTLQDAGIFNGQK